MIICTLGLLLLISEMYLWIKETINRMKTPNQVEPQEPTQPQNIPNNNTNRFNPNIASYTLISIILIVFSLILLIPVVNQLKSSNDENFLASVKYLPLLKDLGFCAVLPLVIYAKNPGLQEFIVSNFRK